MVAEPPLDASAVSLSRTVSSIQAPLETPTVAVLQSRFLVATEAPEEDSTLAVVHRPDASMRAPLLVRAWDELTAELLAG